MQKEYKKQPKILLWEITLKFKFETTHLGLRRTTSEENKINVNDRISLARRTLCSLIKTGVHGTNGLNPRTSCKIYQVYVVPRLLYGLETLDLQYKDLTTLCRFHSKHIETYSISSKQNSNISNLLASRSTANECWAPQKTVESSTLNSNESK